MRIKYEYDGVIYNLGVVDNHQSEGLLPSNRIEVTYTPTLFLMLIIIAILLMILGPYISPVLKFIGDVMLLLLKIIFSIICFPFKLLKKLFNKKPPN